MSPRPKVDHLRKPQIIQAASEVLRERGLLATRIGDIAERAGTSPALILYHFESKDRLLEAAVDFSDGQFYDGLTAEVFEYDRADAQLAKLIDHMSTATAGSSDWTLWMEIWARARREPTVRDSYFSLDRRQRKLIARIVRQGKKEGCFRADIAADDFALTLSALVGGLGVQVTLGQPDVSGRRMVELCRSLAEIQLDCKLPWAQARL